MLKLNKDLGSWSSLGYWRTGEWQAVEEKLRDEPQSNPAPADLFAALRAVGLESCTVAILGQDPYPQRKHCTGIAFSCPRDERRLPPTLINIFKEYEDDLGLPRPLTGDLTPWCEQGVLLWNVYPSCATGRPGSHHWDEWTYLTKEIVEKLNAKHCIFCLLGQSAGNFGRFIDRSRVIRTSHPSPLGAKHGFLGSRIFSRINAELIKLNKEPIDWKLGEGDGQS